MLLREKLKKLAKEHGWNLKILHKVIQDLYGSHGVSYFTLSRLGNNNAKLRAKTVHQICAALGIKKEELLRDTDETYKEPSSQHGDNRGW